MNKFLFIIYQLYLLQLEDYEIGRYWKLLFQRGYVYTASPLRKYVVWTKKAISLFILSLVLYGTGMGIVFAHFPIQVSILYTIGGMFLFPVFYTISLIILLPFDYVAKKIIIARAMQKLRSRNIKIIAIAGSYGKTTMKNVLSSVLSATHAVITTPESVNTPVGIAQWLLKSISNESNIAIIEMGEHYQGDIKQLCSFFPPDISILTGINEAHLERLGTLDVSIKTMFEVVQYSKEHSYVVLNADDERIRNAYSTYGKNKKITFYSAQNNSLSEIKITKKQFDEKHLRWSCVIEKFDEVTIPLLGEYILGDVIAAVIVGKYLNMKNDDMKKGIQTLKPVPHRLEPIQGNGGVLVIDDSYNGNTNGVKEAISVLSRFKNRRKLYITPGLVETGSQVKEAHISIGRQLASVADKVILVKNSVTPYIAQGLKERGYKENNIFWFTTALEAHEALPSILEKNDVILFQNDWGDQYI